VMITGGWAFLVDGLIIWTAYLLIRGPAQTSGGEEAGDEGEKQ